MCVKIRKANEPEYRVTTKESTKLGKTYPAFKGEGSEEWRNKTGRNNQSQKKPNESVKETKQEKPIVEKKTEIKTEPKKVERVIVEEKEEVSNEKIDLSQFEEFDLQEPDRPDKIACYRVIEFMEASLNAEIKKVTGRIPKELKDKYLKCKTVKSVDS